MAIVAISKGARAGFISLAIVMASAVGCADKNWGTIEGVVKLDGQPVGPGAITLEPMDAERAGAVGSFGEDGRYAVMSAGRKPGAAAGRYRVLVHGGEDFGTEATGPRPPSKVPTRYGSAATSGLEVTIESGQKTFDIELKS